MLTSSHRTKFKFNQRLSVYGKDVVELNYAQGA